MDYFIKLTCLQISLIALSFFSLKITLFSSNRFRPSVSMDTISWPNSFTRQCHKVSGIPRSRQKEYPSIPVELYEYGSIKAANMVLEETLDLALVNMNFYEIDKLNSYQLLSDRIVFCVSPKHHLAQEKEISLEMLKDEKLIMYNTDSVLNTTLYSRFEGAGIKPNVIMHASQLYTIQNFISNNLGGAFLYSSLMKNLPGLIGIPIAPAIQQEIGLVWKKGKYVNDSVEKYISFTQKKVF